MENDVKSYRVKIIRWQEYTATVEALNEQEAVDIAFFATCKRDAPESKPTDTGWTSAGAIEIKLFECDEVEP